MALSLTPLIIKNPFGKIELPKRMSWTSSSIKLFRSCKRKWFWKYVMRLKPRQRDRNLMIGSIFHETLGQWYRGARSDMSVIASRYANTLRDEIERAGDWFDQDDMDDVQATANTFVGMMCGYAEQYQDDKKKWSINRKSIEYKFKINMGDFDFMGKMDLVASTRNIGTFLTEHKTSSKIDEGYIDRLPLDTQIRGYTFAATTPTSKGGLGLPIDHVLYDVVRKCRLRKKSGESVEQFDERVAADYLDRPPFYFYREPLEFKREHLDVFEYELKQTHLEYVQLCDEMFGVADPTNPRAWLPNDSQCYNYFRACEYLPLCSRGLTAGTAQHLHQSEHMHEEVA